MLNVKLKPPVGGSKSLLISESLRLNRIIQTIHSFINETRSETQNRAVAVFGIICVLEIEQKQPIWYVKHKYLN